MEILDVKKKGADLKKAMQAEKKDILNEVAEVRKTIQFTKESSEPEPLIETEAEIVPEVNDPDNDPANETVKEPEAEPEIIDDAIDDASDILNDIKGVTEGDLNKNKTIADTISDTIGGKNLDFNTNIDVDNTDPKTRKNQCLVKSDSWVNIIDLVIPLIFGKIDGGGIAMSNIAKYKLIDEYKKGIKENIFLILLNSKKKHNPVWSLLLMILASYIPAGALAFQTRTKRAQGDNVNDQERLIRELQEKIRGYEKKNNIEPEIYQSYDLPIVNSNDKKDFIMNADQKKRMRAHLLKYRRVVNPDNKIETYEGGAGRVPLWVKKMFI